MNHTRTIIALLFLLVPLSAFSQNGQGEEELTEDQRFYRSLDWQAGPGNFPVTEFASIDLPEGFDRLNTSDTARLMDYFQNPGSVGEYYVGPIDERWFAVFSYEDTGHIEDNEDIDIDALLESLRAGTEAGNVERRKRGWAEMNIVGWQYEPAYSDRTNRLSWAILAESEGEQIVNYNTRLLGRTGVISAVLVADPATLETSVTEFETLLEGFEYNPGQTYAEYQPGDKLATYGLAALVTGGAAVAVTKGMGKGAFKAIGLALLAGFAFLWGRIKRMFGAKETPSA